MCTCQKRRQNSVSGSMKRGTFKIITTGASVAAGYAAGKFVSNLSFVQANPIFSVIAPLGGALLTQSFLGKNAIPVAVGMAAAGVINGVTTYLPGVASAAGLAGVPYRSAYLPGVSGSPYEIAPSVRMG